MKFELRHDGRKCRYQRFGKHDRRLALFLLLSEPYQPISCVILLTCGL
jgi:hypothetical protein